MDFKYFLFKDEYKYKQADLYAQFKLGKISLLESCEKEGVEPIIDMVRLADEIYDSYKSSGLLPIKQDSEGKIVLGYIDGLRLPTSGNIALRRISICEFFEKYASIYGMHPDINVMPAKAYIDCVFDEAIELGAMDITMSYLPNEIGFYYNVHKRKVWSKIKLPLSMLSQTINALTGISYSSKDRETKKVRKIINNGEYVGRVEIGPLAGGLITVTIRLIKNEKFTRLPEDCGYNPETLKGISEALLANETGLRLFMGSTCSGKNFSILTYINQYVKSGKYKIISVEDPVENELDGVEQIEATDTTFADYCYSLIRHNPDIVYITETNDYNGKAVAAVTNTGKVVYSTLHANSVPNSFNRLTYVTGLPRDVLIPLVSTLIYQELYFENGKAKVLANYCHFTEEMRQELIGLDDGEFYRRLEGYVKGDDIAAYRASIKAV